MSYDAGSVSSSVRLKLDQLDKDIKSVRSAFDTLGDEFARSADQFSTAGGKRYKAALESIALESRNVESVVKSGALSQQQGIERLIALRKQELSILQNKAVKEGTASAETVKAIRKTEQALSLLEEKQKALGSTGSGSMLGTFQKMQAVMQGPVAALHLVKGAITSVANVTRDLTQASVDAQEVISKYGAVFDGMGVQAEDAANRFASSFGLANTTAKEMLSNTGNLLQGMGATKEESLALSLEVNSLASDLASFTNNAGGSKAASDALTKALLGERESMKSLGIAILESDVVARVAKNGQEELTGSALKLARAQATLELITEQSANAIGDYARTQDSASNSQKRAAESTKEMQIQLGNMLIGPLGKAAGAWADFADSVTETIKRSTGVGKLTGATNDLVEASITYKNISDQLAASSDNLSASERGVLETRKQLASLEMEKALYDISKAYEQTNKQIADLQKTSDNYASNITKNYDIVVRAQQELAKESIKGSAEELIATVDLEDARANILILEEKRILAATQSREMFVAQRAAIESVARSVNDGTISIESYRRTNIALYTDIMNVAEAIKVSDEVTRQRTESDRIAAQESERAAAIRAEAEQASAEQIKNRIAAEQSYNMSVNDAHFRRSKNLIDEKQEQDLLKRAAQSYLDTLIDLGYASENEIGTKGRAALEEMISLLQLTEVETEDLLSKRLAASDAERAASLSKIKDQQEIINGVMMLGRAEQSSIEKSRNASIQQIKNSGLVISQQEELIAKVNEYYDTLSDAESAKQFEQNISESLSSATDLMSAYFGLVKQLNDNAQDAYMDKLDKETNALNNALSERQKLEQDALKKSQDEQQQFLDEKYEAFTSELNAELQEVLFAAGLTKAATIDQYQSELDAANATGDAEKIKTAQDALDKALIEQEYADRLVEIERQRAEEQSIIDQKAAEDKAALEKQQAFEKTQLDEQQALKKAKIEYKYQLASWEMQLTMAGAMAAQAVLNAYASAAAVPITGWLTAPVAAGLAGGIGLLQVAAVAAARPKAPKLAEGGSFIVPNGYPNDSYAMPAAWVQSGERVTVETPAQQKANKAVNLQIGTVIGSPSGLRELSRLLAKYGLVEDKRVGR